MPPIESFLCMIISMLGMIIHEQGGMYAPVGKTAFYLWSIAALVILWIPIN